MKILKHIRRLLWDVWNVFFPSREWLEEGRRELEEQRLQHEEKHPQP